MARRIGKYTIFYDTPPVIEGYASVAGKKESEGPLGKMFDRVFDDEYLGQDSFEKAESEMQRQVLSIAMEKSGVTPADIDILFAGDLLNQCSASTFGLGDYNIPYVGIYGACSTMALGLCMASSFVEGGLAQRTACVTSSHFCSSERQFRLPLEYGGQRTPTAQWTVTGAGSVIVTSLKNTGIKIRGITLGRTVDKGINDVNNMGAAMAPAAADTIKTFLTETATSPTDYDLILTGDLGQVGSRLLCEILQNDGIDISKVHSDCGTNIFFDKKQDVHSGGSGCGCSASVLCSKILNNMTDGNLKKVLFCATGSLHSPTTVLQNQTIPGISHLVYLEV